MRMFPQETSAVAAVFLCDPTCEKATPENPQIFRSCKFKNNISAQYAQSTAEGIQNHKEAVSMNYEQAMEYIHAVQWAGHKPGLSRTRTLLAALGDPHKRLRFVHVAGTNGKGSTAAMLASCLQAAGYRVGLFTSPFINRFNERIQVDGQQIPDEELVQLVERVQPAADAMADVPTEFEIITALGMLYFARKQCDIVVLEVGLGGTLDSTNVIENPACAVITALGMDHVRELGLLLQQLLRKLVRLILIIILLERWNILI